MTKANVVLVNTRQDARDVAGERWAHQVKLLKQQTARLQEELASSEARLQAMEALVARHEEFLELTLD